MTLHKILLVEDDALLADGVSGALTQCGFQVDHLADGLEAFNALAYGDYAAAIVDINLPSKDGLSIVKDLRLKNNSTPILMLTARDTLEDCVTALDNGADDYVTKPFELTELEARLRALVRRKPNEIRREMIVGDLHYDIFGRRAYIGEYPVDLSARETDLLEVLLSQRGKIVNKDDLIERMFPSEQEIGPNAIEVYIHRLRKKCAKANITIKTHRGLGYILDVTT